MIIRRENVIYVNQSHHEQQPDTFIPRLPMKGIQAICIRRAYYAGTRSWPVKYFNFGGYDTGRMGNMRKCAAGYLSSLSKEQATLLQKNNKLYSGSTRTCGYEIHYDGWSRIDTVAFQKLWDQRRKTIERICMNSHYGVRQEIIWNIISVM